jgi:Ni,Fe-hydrogenase III small subunit
MENSDSQIEQNTITSPETQNMSEESNYRMFQVSATDDELFHTPSQVQIPGCSNIPKNTYTNISTAHCLKDQEHKTDSDRLLSENK